MEIIPFTLLSMMCKHCNSPIFIGACSFYLKKKTQSLNGCEMLLHRCHLHFSESQWCWASPWWLCNHLDVFLEMIVEIFLPRFRCFITSFMLELHEFFDDRDTSLIKYLICEYFPPCCRLSFCFLDSVHWWTKLLTFTINLLIFFLYFKYSI